MRPTLRLWPTAQGFSTATRCWQCRFASTKREQARAVYLDKVNRSLHQGDEHSATLALDAESKRIRTAAGDLPISPIMDPSWIEAKQRHKTPKPLPKKGPSEGKGRFRKKLENNPFAQALATPWRECAISQAGMPRQFLQMFELVKNPDDGNPWFVPVDMDQQQDRKEASETQNKDASENGATPEANRPPHQPAEADIHSLGYLTCRQDIVRALGNAKLETDERGKAIRRSTLFGKYRRILARRPTLVRAGIVGSVVWRGDMDMFVLDEMRRRIVSSLIRLAEASETLDEGRGYILPCDNWSKINKDMSFRGCVLWYATGAAQGNAPGPMATLDIEGATYERTLPVHNLDRLLGKEHLEKLREHPVFRDSSLLVVRKTRSRNVQWDLWKLQGYLGRGNVKM